MNEPKSIEIFYQGQGIQNTEPGDIILTHRNEIYSKLIVFGQGLRFRGKNRVYAHWSHVACVVDSSGGLVEALGNGVQGPAQGRNIEEYRDVEYVYINIGACQHDREQMQKFLLACIGRPYGWFEIISLGLALLTGTKVIFGNPATLICSALAAQSLTRGNFIWSRDPNVMMPADIAKEFDIIWTPPHGFMPYKGKL
jgi:hypothetical protein